MLLDRQLKNPTMVACLDVVTNHGITKIQFVWQWTMNAGCDLWWVKKLSLISRDGFEPRTREVVRDITACHELQKESKITELLFLP